MLRHFITFSFKHTHPHISNHCSCLCGVCSHAEFSDGRVETGCWWELGRNVTLDTHGVEHDVLNALHCTSVFTWRSSLFQLAGRVLPTSRKPLTRSLHLIHVGLLSRVLNSFLVAHRVRELLDAIQKGGTALPTNLPCARLHPKA